MPFTCVSFDICWKLNNQTTKYENKDSEEGGFNSSMALI